VLYTESLLPGTKDSGERKNTRRSGIKIIMVKKKGEEKWPELARIRANQSVLEPSILNGKVVGGRKGDDS